MKNIKMFLLSLVASNMASAQLLVGDTALLVELVTTTASQLNELEKLVSSTEKYTAKMQQYNELFQDEYLRAERVLYVAESLAAKKETKNLNELNWAIRELKYSMSDMKGLMHEYAVIKSDEKNTKTQTKAQRKVNDQKEKIAVSQVDKSVKASNTGRATQLTAQNTAMIYEQNVDMHNTQLDMLDKISTTNRLLAEQMEDKRLEQIERERSYGISGSRK